MEKEYLSSKYIQLYAPEHPHCNSSGYIYEHRYIVELKLDRYLNTYESVHHIDLNKENNNPENLIVFRTHNDHKRFHNYKYETYSILQLVNLGCIIEHKDGSFSCPKKTNVKKECKYCGKPFSTEIGSSYSFCSLECRKNSKIKNLPSVSYISTLVDLGMSNYKIAKICECTQKVISDIITKNKLR